MPAVPQISLLGVHKKYPNGTVALRDVTLIIPKQDFVFLVGPSGAGKSTLVRLLIREEKVTDGKIHVEGQDLSRLKRRHLPFLRRKIGMVFQDFKLLPNLTVFQNVAFALRVTEGALRHLKPKVEEVLSIVGLEGKENKFPDQLSGGEQQRVAIARALVHDPRIFLADEPTGNLDPATSWEIIQLLLQINARGTTVLMATHNREIVDVMRRRVVAIESRQTFRDEAAGGYHAPALESRWLRLQQRVAELLAQCCRQHRQRPHRLGRPARARQLAPGAALARSDRGARKDQGECHLRLPRGYDATQQRHGFQTSPGE